MVITNMCETAATNQMSSNVFRSLDMILNMKKGHWVVSRGLMSGHEYTCMSHP